MTRMRWATGTPALETQPHGFQKDGHLPGGRIIGCDVLKQDTAGSQVCTSRHSHQACAAIDAVPRYRA